MYKWLINTFQTDSKLINFILVIIGILLLLLLIKFRNQVRACISIVIFLLFLGVFTGFINYKTVVKTGEMKLAEKAIESQTGGDVKYKNGKLYAKQNGKWVNISKKVDKVNDTVDTVVAGQKVAVKTITDLVNNNKGKIKITDKGIKVKQGNTYIPLDSAAISTIGKEINITNGVITVKCKNKKKNKDEWVDITKINSNYTVPKDIDSFVRNTISSMENKINKEKNK